VDMGIVGTGHMAQALGRQWVRAGHRVLVGGRDPGRADALAAALGGHARSGTLRDAARFGDAVLLAVRRTGVPAALRAAGADEGSMAGRVLVDCTNPIDEADGFRLVTSGGPSMAERIATLATGVEVAKAFNLCSADLWRATPPAVGGRALVVPFCAATPRARELTSGLVTDLGCRPLYLGGLERAGQLEAVAALGIRLLVEGVGFDAVMPSAQPGPPPGRQSSMAW
jgi:8-hydroxy-5-deazaflavin:NADPH oxidoreductase